MSKIDTSPKTFGEIFGLSSEQANTIGSPEGGERLSKEEEEKFDHMQKELEALLQPVKNKLSEYWPSLDESGKLIVVSWCIINIMVGGLTIDRIPTELRNIANMIEITNRRKIGLQEEFKGAS